MKSPIFPQFIIKSVLVLLPILLLVVLVSPIIPTVPAAGAARAAAPVAPSPSSASDLSAVTASANQFAFDLYRRLSPTPGNLVLSPASVYLGLAHVMAGARGQTEREFRDTLHVNLPNETFHRALGGLYRSLTGTNSYDLNLSARVWVRKGTPVKAPFSKLLSANYDLATGVFNSPADAEAINAWVRQQTKGQIPEVVQPNSITDHTLLLLATAAYFHGYWSQFFNPAQPDDFFIAPGNKVRVNMLFQQSEYLTIHRQGYTVLALPYQHCPVYMLVVLPDAVDGLAKVERSLDPAIFHLDLSGKGKNMEVSLPKFKFKNSLGLVPSLGRMGLAGVFKEGTADLSGIDGARDLFLGQVVQQAMIEVNEEGTIAATGGAVMIVNGPPEDRFIADHPFLFFIQDTRTGLVLFMGRVTDPR